MKNINSKNSEFGYSGSHSYHYKTNIKTKDDTLVLIDKISGNEIGKIIRKNNDFWINSSLISKFKNVETSQYFKLKYAKSTEEVN